MALRQDCDPLALNSKKLALPSKLHGAAVNYITALTLQISGKLMAYLENRCANCGGRFGLICHHYWGLRFCRKICKDNFLAKTAKDRALISKWFGRAGSRKEGSRPFCL